MDDQVENDPADLADFYMLKYFSIEASGQSLNSKCWPQPESAALKNHNFRDFLSANIVLRNRVSPPPELINPANFWGMFFGHKHAYYLQNTSMGDEHY